MALDKPYLTPVERKRVSFLTRGLYNYDEPTPTSILRELFGKPVDTTVFVDIPRSTKNPELMTLFGLSCRTQGVLSRLKMRSILEATDTYHVAGWLTSLDYATATNILVWYQLHGNLTFTMLKKWGFFNSQTDFHDKAKLLGSRVKVYPKSFKLKMAFAELIDLAGFRLVDDSFDLEAECKSLASGGSPSQNYRHFMFCRGLDDILGSETITPKHQLSFYEYVTQGLWLTTGSSSIGRVDWTYDDAKGHFKARKNMLLDIYSREEIWDLVSSWDGTIHNKPLVKCELGKMRLAVASNLESYIHEAYLMSIIGHVYTRWKYITLDEKEPAYVRRTCKLREALKSGGYALPWDFKSFDHQATTLEIQTILRAIFSRTPISAAVSQVLEKVILSYARAELILGDRSFPVLGGLQSGQRITSLIGNVWNAAVTSAVIEIVRLFVPNLTVHCIAVRGDDTYIVTATALQAYYIRLCYAAMWAVGNDAKFSIRQFSCEFLRSETSSYMTTAWPNRAIAAITQRKPWSDNPWDPVREVCVIADNIRNVERRCSVVLRGLHLAARIQWSKFTRQSYHYLDLPVRLGGLGLYPFKGWTPSSPLPSAQRGTVHITSELHGQAPDFLKTLISDEDYAAASISTKIAAGDVSKASRELTDVYVQKVRSHRVTWTFSKYIPKHYPRLVQAVYDQIPKPPVWRFPKTYNRTNLEPAIAGFPRFDKFLMYYSYIKTRVKHSLKEFARTYYPAVSSAMGMLEKQGFHRTDAITIILGGYPTERNCLTNPRLTSIISTSLRNFGIYTRGRQNIARTIYDYTVCAANILAAAPVTSYYLF